MSVSTESAPQALLLLGPTASGKSALSLELARHYDVEIISIDSALVYRAMDIGSAKPSEQEMSVCPHHLIDIRDISEPYSAAEFLEDACRLINEIHERGRFPLIVGGTMLYAKALREGINDIPSSTLAMREAIAREALECGWPAMHEKLAAVDAVTAARLNPNDSQRIGRALEVWRISGRALSSFHGELSRDSPPLVCVGLMPEDRAKLHRRIEERFDLMLQQGFLDEVKALMSRNDFNRDSPAMRAVGYRQAIEYLSGESDWDAFHLAGVAATRQLAKRQMTWLRGMTNIRLIDPFESGAYDSLAEILAPLAPLKGNGPSK